MRRTSRSRFDVGTVTDPGTRAYQQDALVANFPAGEEIGIGVLADGMGGHMGGDVASALVVGRAFAEIRAGLADAAPGAAAIGPVLREAVEVANAAVRTRIEADPEVRGMGSTLVACVAVGPELHWVSVGDSPLYLYRDGTLAQLNEDHSMAPRIAAMAASGMIDPALAANHPERNQLLSAICGREVEQVDCRETPYALRAGDVLIAASDGIQTLEDGEICRLVHRSRRGSGTEIAEALMRAVKDAARPDQDNIAIMAVKVLSDQPVVRSEPVVDPVALALASGGAPAADGMERADDDLLRALAL